MRKVTIIYSKLAAPVLIQLWEVFVNFFSTQDPNQFYSFILKNETYSILTHSNPVSIFEAG